MIPDTHACAYKDSFRSLVRQVKEQNIDLGLKKLEIAKMKLALEEKENRINRLIGMLFAERLSEK